MKQLCRLLGCAVILSALAGCQSPERGVEVVVEGDGQFPEFLVGKWTAEKARWDFVFQPDGQISSALIGNGAIRVKPSDGIARTSAPKAAQAVYELGEWTVQYTPEINELAVKVVVDHFEVTDADGVRAIEGSSTDWFVGPVSQDHQTWKAEWFTYPKFVIFTPEPVEVPFDPNDNPSATLVFRKQQEKN